MSDELPDDPLWFKDAVIYEIHIRAFQDSTNDGIGDIVGLISRLDYLADLGVTAIWLLPFYPSPLKDGGYDISDYTNVHNHYGTREDVARLLREAHKRGIRVITELVLNHTSSEHPWFQRARRAPPGSRWRDFYVWSDTPERYTQARIIFKDFETSNWSWDPVAKAYYWHRFYSHQPDLNFDNPLVHEAVFKAFDFWLNAGVDGLRLDAVHAIVDTSATHILEELAGRVAGEITGVQYVRNNLVVTDAAAPVAVAEVDHRRTRLRCPPRRRASTWRSEPATRPSRPTSSAERHTTSVLMFHVEHRRD